MYKLRQILPKTPTDTFAFWFSLFGINLVYWTELVVVLPWVAENQAGYGTVKYYFHVVLGTFIYVNTLGFFWKVITTDTSTVGVMLPSLLMPEWRYCYVCESNSPPRSYHCHTCKRCILRRDHHCVFTANCIGLNNHRYYLLLLAYCSAAAIYANIMNADYMWHVLDGFSVWSLLKLIFPFFSWVLQLISLKKMILSGFLLLCIAVALMMSSLLGYHLRNLFFGQLTYERTYKQFQYNLGWRNNYKQIFGRNWAVAWLSPWIPSELPGDGLSFPKAKEYEDPKTM